MNKVLFISFLLLAAAVHGKIAIGGLLGSSASSPFSFAYSGFLYYKFDEQVLIGPSIGQQNSGLPIMGSLYVRLPFGRILMPVGIGELGYFMGEQKSESGFAWRAGGGFDWKNGERSSILLLGGVEEMSGFSNPWARAGLLLEF